MRERTLAIVKPDCLAEGHAGEVIQAYEAAGLRLAAARVERISAERAGELYAEHVQKPFFGELVEYMTSNPVLVIALEGEDAIAAVRAVNGATDPAEAEPGTLRYRLGDSVRRNAVHGSATAEDARRELALFFPELARG